MRVGVQVEVFFPDPHLNIKTYGQTRPHQRPAPSHPNMSGNCPDSEGPRFKDDRGCLRLKGCTCCEKSGAHIYIYRIGGVQRCSFVLSPVALCIIISMAQND